MNIKDDTHIKDFLNNRNLKKHSEDQYIKRLKQYCIFTNMTPTQLIEEAEDEEEERVRMKNRKIKKHLTGFIQHMKNEGKSPNYITGCYATAKTFYTEFEIELPKIKCRVKDQDPLITISDIPTKDDIKKALKYTNIKYKAIIYLMMSSGMGSSEIRHLTIKDYIDALKINEYDLLNIDELIKILRKNENEIPTWSIRRYKTGMPYVTFSSPESVKAINDYIEDRFQRGYNFKSNDDYLFEVHGEHINRRTLTAYFTRLNDTAGFGFYKRQRFFRAHNLRKFFASTLKNNGFDTLDSEWLIGHKVKMVTDAYIKPDIYRLKKEYLDVLPHLSLEEVETKTINSPEYQELLEQNEDLTQKYINIETELEEMRKELDMAKIFYKVANDSIGDNKPVDTKRLEELKDTYKPMIKRSE